MSNAPGPGAAAGPPKALWGMVIIAIALVAGAAMPAAAQTSVAATGSPDVIEIVRMPDGPGIARDELSEAAVTEFLRRHPQVANSARELLLPSNREFARLVLGQNAFLREVELCEQKLSVRLKVRYVEWSQALRYYEDRIEQRLPHPSVAQVGDSWLAYLASRGIIVGEAQRYTWDPRLFWYRNDLFTQDDFATGDSLANALRRVAGRKPPGMEKPFAIPCEAGWELLHVLSALEYAAGARSVVRDRRLPWPHYQTNLSGPAGQIALDWLINLQGSEVLDLADTSNASLTEDFLAGKYGCIIAPAWVDCWARSARHAVSPDRISAAWPPALSDRPGSTFKGGSYFAVIAPEGTPQHQVAKEQAVASFLCSSESQRRYVASSLGFVPADPADAGDSRLGKLFQRAVRDGISYPAKDSWPIAVENLVVRDHLYVLVRRIAVLGPDRSESLADRAARLGLIRAALALADKDTGRRVRDITWQTWWPLAAVGVIVLGLAVGWCLFKWRYRRQLAALQAERARFLADLAVYAAQRPVAIHETSPPWLAEIQEPDGLEGSGTEEAL